MEQQQPNNQQQNDSMKLKRDKLYKQQQQQRLQQNDITRNKDLSADQLIKNILEKVDTDAKITKFYNTHHYQQQQQQQQQQQLLNVNTQQFHQNQCNQSWTNNIHSKPIETSSATNSSTNFYSPLVIPQCFYLHSEIPEIYLKIWQSVQYNFVGNGESEFCDRDRLYQILITSNLSNDVLAKLWSFVNRTKPGELTRNELFVMLALISLVQQNVANPLQELYSIQTIPVPYFSGFSFAKSLFCQESTATTEPIKQIENLSESSFGENEFCEFKSASTNVDDNTPLADLFVTPQNSTLNPINNNNIMTEDLFEVSTITSQLEQTQTKNNNNDDDDFGDFIQTEIVETFNNEEEVNHTNNDFGDQEDLFACTVVQSDTGEQEDKYSFFRKFQNEISVQEEFGDFHSQPIEQEFSTNHHQEYVHTQSMSSTAWFEHEKKNLMNKYQIRERILTAIKQVMHKTFNVLAVNHDETSVIEALTSNKGHTFVDDLYQVYKIAERIKFTVKHDDDDSDDKCRTLVDEIDRNWNSIHNLMKKASITLNDRISQKEFHYENGDDDKKCWICSTRVILGNNNNNNNDDDDDNKQVESITNDSLGMTIDANNGGNDIQYHLTCVNFWLNFVDTTTLPHHGERGHDSIDDNDDHYGHFHSITTAN
ncbi:uncharacterized protein LOC124497229 isoform X1 [Dermatophagoides farinae]|uniref:uncharacterized protein LOC124497229 isoform X1 n=1 Tax=Dermatophagoides farinae TaxID=6954 RepID=UPI003F60D9E6